MQEYVGEYVYNGRRICLNIVGNDADDALARVESIKASYRVVGVICPASEDSG